MANVAWCQLDTATRARPSAGVHLSARGGAETRWTVFNVIILALSSSSYRQSFCFLVRNDEIEKSRRRRESCVIARIRPRLCERCGGGPKRRTSGCGGRGDAGSARVLRGAFFTAIFRAVKGERDRDCAGIERTHDLDCGGAGWPRKSCPCGSLPNVTCKSRYPLPSTGFQGVVGIKVLCYQ